MALPLIIAGPILRRVEPGAVSVWMAFTEEVAMGLDLYDGKEISADDLDTTPKLDVEASTAKTFQFGRRLWIGVVTAKPTSPLTHGKIYSYNIEFASPTDTATSGSFKTEGLLKNGKHNGRKQVPIGYGEGRLPSFVLTDPDPAKLKLAQASCRKMHGPGFDALAQLDKKIEKDEGFRNLDKRPQQLFLTGDQVYADDVPIAVLHYINSLDAVGIGLEEKVAFDGGTAPGETEAIAWPPNLRQGLTRKVAGMTSGSAGSHVLSFSEYARLYLMYWSNRAWDLELYNEVKKIQDDNKDSVLSGVARTMVKPFPAPPVDEDSLHAKYKQARESNPALLNLGLTKQQEGRHIGIAVASSFDVGSPMDEPKQSDSDEMRYRWHLRETFLKLKKELRELANFADGLPNVSRLLANVPSYMIFDDHEVTDDWYLNRRWKNEVLSKRLGRDVIRNGLMAYAVFQDWGNVPAQYKPDGPLPVNPDPRTKLIRRIIEYCAALTTPADRPAAADQIEVLLGMTGGESEVKWHFDVKCGPTRAFVLDTRTRREYESLNAPPGLISSAALAEQLPSPHPDGAVPFSIVVSAAPAPGLQSFEQLFQPAGAAYVGIKNKNELGEVGLARGFVEFDYEAWGFSVKAIEGLLERIANYKSAILFCGDVHYGFSSVLDYWKGSNTTPIARVLTFTSSAAKNEVHGPLHLTHAAFVQKVMTGIGNNLEKLGWKDRTLSVTGPASLTNRRRLRKNPAVIPVAGWIPGSTVNRQPDFRWRMRMITDTEDRAGDPVSSNIDLADPASIASGYEKVTARHQDNFVSGIHRRMVWPANVGLLSFESSGGNITAVHEFLFVAGSRGADAGSAKPHIKHKSPLVTPAGERARPELP